MSPHDQLPDKNLSVERVWWWVKCEAHEKDLGENKGHQHFIVFAFPSNLMLFQSELAVFCFDMPFFFFSFLHSPLLHWPGNYFLLIIIYLISNLSFPSLQLCPNTTIFPSTCI